MQYDSKPSLDHCQRAASRQAIAMSIRVLLVDDQAMVRAGFRMILESTPNIEVVGEVENGEQAVAATRRLRPDVVLMDIQMPVEDGLQATRRITASHGLNSRVVILTTSERDEYVFEALQAGASGFLLKNAPRAAHPCSPSRGRGRRPAGAVDHAPHHRAVRGPADKTRLSGSSWNFGGDPGLTIRR
jgi:CheY-like chemotaxis protein